jgi:hypothetical protein
MSFFYHPLLALITFLEIDVLKYFALWVAPHSVVSADNMKVFTSYGLFVLSVTFTTALRYLS